MLFIAKLAQQRSPAAAALLFLLLVDEIEALIFMAVGVLMKRVDLFLDVQTVLFPAIVVLSATIALIRNWRRHKAEQVVVEHVDVSVLAERIGSRAPLTLATETTSPTVRSQWVATQSVTGDRPLGIDVAVHPLTVSGTQYTPLQRNKESEYRASIAALHGRTN